MGETAWLARHRLACARTHRRQRLGRAAARYLQRAPPTHTRRTQPGSTRVQCLGSSPLVFILSSPITMGTSRASKPSATRLLPSINKTLRQKRYHLSASMRNAHVIGPRTGHHPFRCCRLLDSSQAPGSFLRCDPARSQHAVPPSHNERFDWANAWLYQPQFPLPNPTPSTAAVVTQSVAGCRSP